MKHLEFEMIEKHDYLISIIVPVYNVEQYLDRCIRSIVNQTYHNLEIILIDDGSSDGCPQICDAWADRDERVKVIHKQNAGPGPARNSGMKIATGEYWMYVDSDDYIAPNAVQVLLDRVLQDNSEMAIGRIVNIDEDGVIDNSACSWMKNTVMTKEDVFERASEEYYIPVNACEKLYKKELFNNVLFPELRCGEDFWVFAEIIDKCNKISIVEEDIYFYFQRNDSAMHKMTEKIRIEEIEILLHFAKYLYQHNYLKSAQRWYGQAINRALLLKNKRNGYAIFEKYFNSNDIKTLLKNAGAAIHLGWVSIVLNIPVPGAMIRVIKPLIRKTLPWKR